MGEDAVQVEALQKHLAPLVDEGRLDATEPALAVLPHSLDDEDRAHGVPDHRRLEKLAALLYEDEAAAASALVGGAERCQGGQQEAMRDRLAEPRTFGVLDVMVNRMNVAR